MKKIVFVKVIGENKHTGSLTAVIAINTTILINSLHHTNKHDRNIHLR